MKHPLQEQGWLQMQNILDQEMPIRAKKRYYLLPFAVMFSLSVIAIAIVVKANQIGKAKAQNPIPKNEIQSPIAANVNGQSNHSNDQNEIQLSQSVVKANQFIESSTPDKIDVVELAQTQSRPENGMKILQDPMKKHTYPEYKKSYNDKVSEENIETESNVFVGQSELSTHQDPPQINVNSVPQITSSLLKESQQIYRLTLSLAIKEQEAKKNWNFDIIAGIGQSVLAKNEHHFFTQIGAMRHLNHKMELFGAAGVSLHNFDIKNIILAKDKLENDPNIINLDVNSGSNILNSKSTIFAEISLGFARKLNSKFKVGIGCGMSYLISVGSKNKITAAGYSAELIDESFSKVYVSPFLRSEYKLNGKWSLSGQYNHGLTGVSSILRSKNDQFYFREVRLGTKYHL